MVSRSLAAVVAALLPALALSSADGTAPARNSLADRAVHEHARDGRSQDGRKKGQVERTDSEKRQQTAAMVAAWRMQEQQMLQEVFPFPELLRELREVQVSGLESAPMPALSLVHRGWPRPPVSLLGVLGEEKETQDAVQWWKTIPSNLTFIHIARTGGSAVETLRNDVEKKTPVPVRMWGTLDKQNQHGLEPVNKHRRITSAQCYLQHHPANLNQKAFKGTDTFCVVRDPVQRAISQFGFAANFYPKAGKCNVDDMNKYFDKTFAKLKDHAYMEDCHWLPQSAYVYAWDVETGETDYSQGRFCKNILRFDHVTEDFNMLMERYGYPFRFNENKRSGFSSSKACGALRVEDMKPEAVQFIKDFYRDDYTLLQDSDAEAVEAAEQRAVEDAAANQTAAQQF